MLNAVSIIQRLEAESSRKGKEQIIIDAYMTGERTFFYAARMALDDLVTFGVKKVPEIVEEDDGFEGSFDYNDFCHLALKLRSRDLTGHDARDAILDAIDKCNVTEWNVFYRRILRKDLGCGVDASTINKALKRFAKSDPEVLTCMVPVFSCQLAHDGAKPEHEKKISGKKFLDLKLDGVRFLTFLDKETNTVTQYTRNGKVNSNFPHLMTKLHSLMQELPESVVLDGELVGENFQDLMKYVNAKSPMDVSHVRLAVFDIIPLEDFRNGISNIPQDRRHMNLTDLVSSGVLFSHCGKSVYALSKMLVDLDTEDGRRQFSEFNRMAIEEEYEGIMVKDVKAPYKVGRNFAWLKIKPFIEITMKVVGFYEGEGKYVGKLGGLIMEGIEDGKIVKTEVGSGFSDEDRATLWNGRHKLAGMMGEVRGDALTQAENNEHYSVRFPRWKGFRGSVAGEIV